MKLFLPVLFLISFLCTHAQDASHYNADVANHYFSFALKLTKETTGFTAPVASRAFGFTGLALYEAVVSGIPSMTSTSRSIPELENITKPDANLGYHWPTVANNALAGIIDSLWEIASQVNKDSLHAIRDHYNTLFSSQIPGSDYAASKAFGEAIANDIFQYSKTDGGHRGFATNSSSSYIPPAGPGLWEPFGPQTAIQPYWGTHRPFITDDTISVISNPPPAFSSSPTSVFYAYAYQVYYHVNNNTAEEVAIAQYWADGSGSITPAGHSISMLHNILVHEDVNLETATIAYAKMGIALSDATLASWKTKYKYDLCRPVTFIQEYIDDTWVSLTPTPAFPEYNSGHAAQSGAMSEVMESLFGTAYAFTDSTNGSNFGGPRSFTNFDEAAEEVAVSGVYAGINYEFSNTKGLETGRAVGENVNEFFTGLIASVEENNGEKYGFEIYPNPATDVVTFYGKGIKIDRIDIYNMMGQQVAFSASSTGKMDVSALAPGIYLLNARDLKKGIMASKTLVKR